MKDKKKLLLLLLLPPGAVGISLAWVGLWELAGLCLLCALLGLGLQALTLRKGPRWSRWATLLPTTIPLYLAWQASVSQSLFQGLVVLLWLTAALCYLLSWGAAWGLPRGEGPSH